MADSYVCSGAMMQCTMGEQPAQLTVLPSRTVFLCGKPMANISDHVSMVNLAPFGRCRSMGFPDTAAATAAHLGKLTPMPCVHNTPEPWMPGKADYMVQNQPALLKSCKCICKWGGVISLINDGQVGEGTQWVQKSSKETFVTGSYKKNETPDLSRSLVDFRSMEEKKIAAEARSRDERERRRSIEVILSKSENGVIVWDNDRFRDLEKESADFMKTEEGRDRLRKAKAAFEKTKPNLESITYRQLYEIVGQTLGLKPQEVSYKKEYDKTDGLLGWQKGNNAYLNEYEENNMSICQKIAVYAHESGHIAQKIVIKNAPKDIKSQSPYEKKLVFANQTYKKHTDDLELYERNFLEIDARRYEMVFGKACVDYYNQTIDSSKAPYIDKDLSNNYSR